MILTRLLLSLLLLVSIRHDSSLCEGSKPGPEPSDAKDTDNPTCQCGVFDTSKPEKGATPVLQNGACIAVPCNETGVAACREMCMALAMMAKEKAATLLCSQLHERSRPFKPAVFSWHCINKQWVFTGLASPRSLTCHNGKPLFEDEKRITTREVPRSEMRRRDFRTTDEVGKAVRVTPVEVPAPI